MLNQPCLPACCMHSNHARAYRDPSWQSKKATAVLVMTRDAANTLMLGTSESHEAIVQDVGNVIDALADAANDCVSKAPLAGRLLLVHGATTPCRHRHRRSSVRLKRHVLPAMLRAGCVGQLVLVLHEAIAVGIDWPSNSVLSLDGWQAGCFAKLQLQRKRLAKRSRTAKLVVCPSLHSAQMTMVETGLLALPKKGAKAKAAKAAVKLAIAVGKSIAVRCSLRRIVCCPRRPPTRAFYAPIARRQARSTRL